MTLTWFPWGFFILNVSSQDLRVGHLGTEELQVSSSSEVVI